MKVVVIGGIGLVGSRLAGTLRQGGHDVVASSPSSGVNPFSGDGLPEVMENADVVVDLGNPPSFDGEAPRNYFFVSGHNLLAAKIAAGVRHHVVLSDVGTDRMQDSGYFRAKHLQEQIVRASGMPYTILRSTQLFESMEGMAGSNIETRIVRLSSALAQPLAADDVAEMLAQLCVRAPLNEIVELAGPEVFRISDIVERILARKFDDRLVVADDNVRFLGVKLQERSLIPDPSHRIAPTRLDTWLSA